MAIAPALNRILDKVRVNCPGAIDGAIFTAYFDAMDDFLNISGTWVTCLTQPVLAGVTNYTIVPSAGKIKRLVAVRNSTASSQGGTSPPSTISPWQSDNVSAGMTIPGKLVLQFAPNVDGMYDVALMLTVADPVSALGFPIVPIWILEQYREAIEHRIIAELMLQIAKPYSNEKGGTYHMLMFRKYAYQAKNEALHQNVFRGQNWEFPQNFINE